MKQNYKKIVVSTSVLILVGCGETGLSSFSRSANTVSSHSETSNIGRAYYIDSAVSGVNYICGSQSGTTDGSGMFLFEINKGCTFSLGTMMLRKIDPNWLYDGEKLYELDKRIGTILQSLDEDQDLSNGIKINQEIVTKLDKDYNVVPTEGKELEAFENKIRDEGAQVPSPQSSERHVVNTILSNDLYRVENNKTQQLTFEDDGNVLIEEDDEIVDYASYTIDKNNTVSIQDQESADIQRGNIESGREYLAVGNDKLWFSKRLADKSKKTNNSLQNSEDDSSTEIYQLSDNTKTIYLDAINKARSQVQDCGKNGMMGPADPLTWNAKLYNAAMEHSIDMGTVDFFSHDGSGKYTDVTARVLALGKGSTSAQRVEFNGYSYEARGENIAAGIEDINAVINAWIDSDDHCANLMSAAYTEVGLSKYVNKNTKHKYFWTQVFGRP